MGSRKLVIGWKIKERGGYGDAARNFKFKAIETWAAMNYSNYSM